MDLENILSILRHFQFKSFQIVTLTLTLVG